MNATLFKKSEHVLQFSIIVELVLLTTKPTTERDL